MMTPALESKLQEIQAYMRLAATYGRDIEQVGPFLATFTSHDEMIYLNYAIPVDGATPSPEDIAALILAYERRERKPRLEYIPGLAPNVEPALIEAGFTAEGLFPLMVYSADSGSVSTPSGVEVSVAATDEDLRAALTAQREAYDDLTPPEEDDINQLRASIEAGGITVLARDLATGEVVGAGGCMPPAHGITELVGVGVREAFRRRGIAAAVTARLAREAYAAGITTIFLAAAPGEAERVYGRVGFERVTEMLHISKL